MVLAATNESVEMAKLLLATSNVEPWYIIIMYAYYKINFLYVSGLHQVAPMFGKEIGEVLYQVSTSHLHY